jgi:hypothetical protein
VHGIKAGEHPADPLAGIEFLSLDDFNNSCESRVEQGTHNTNLASRHIEKQDSDKMAENIRF